MNRRVRAVGMVVAFVPTLVLSLGPTLPASSAHHPDAPALGLGIRTASAQEDAVTKEARKRFLEGVKLFDEKKYDLARASFLQAMALKPHPAILLNLAQTELVGGQPWDALGHFKQYLNDPATQGDPKRADAEKGVAESRAKLPRAQVSVDVPGADILVDNVKVGQSPLGDAIDLKPGNHTFEAQKDGKSARSTVDPAPGKITMVDLRINGGAPPAVVPPPPLPGTAPPPATAAPGPTAAPPATTGAPPTEIPPSSGPPSPGKWVAVALGGGGLAVVGLGLGIGFAVSASAKDDDATSITNQIRDYASQNTDPLGQRSIPQGRQNNPCANPVPPAVFGACSKLVDKRKERDDARNVSTVGFVVGGIGAAVGLFGGFMYYRAKKANEDTPTARIQVVPMLAPETQGIGVIGRF